MDKVFLPHKISLCDCDLCLALHSVASIESACLSMSITDYLTRTMKSYVFIHCKH